MLENQKEVFVIRGNSGLFLPDKGSMCTVYLIDAKFFNSEEEAEEGINTRAGEFLARPLSIYSVILTVEVGNKAATQVKE